MSARIVRRGKLALACGLWSGAFAGAVLADEFDTLNVQAGSTYLHDSNLFRLPAGSDPNVVLRAPTSSDSISVNSLGVTLNKPYSLQRFELGASFVDYRYKNFTFLNFTAFNYNGAWRWSLTPRLRGNATATRSETLNTFADFRSFIRNVRTETNNRFDAEYEIDGVWRVIGGVGENEVKNEQIFLAQQNYRIQSGEAGVKYAFPSFSNISAIVRSTKGEYTQLSQPVAASLFDNRFDQREFEANLFWEYSGKSNFNFRVGHTDRKHSTFSQRDYQGLYGYATVNWGITGKTRLVSSVSRELASFLQTSSSYTRLDKFSVGPVWEVTSKVVARARYDASSREFLGPIANTPQNDRVDKLRTLYAGADWRPYRWVTMSISLQNDIRSSNLPGFDFKSTTGTLSAQVTF
jgi:exopolysaccharide biosynthesis operon protein EpsL